MNDPYVYEEDRTEEGITFKKVGYFFKKAWLRMLIYAVIFALLTTAVAVPIKVFYKSEPLAVTSVEFIYDGIEDGLDPRGGALVTDNMISMTVLKSAVDEANLGGKIKDISKLRESMRVEGVKTDEYVRLVEAAANGDRDAAEQLRGYVMHPTRFDIIISDPDELDLSDDEAVMLLDHVVDSYCRDFRKRFSVTAMFASDVYGLSADKRIEFVDIYDMYYSSLDTMGDYLTMYATTNPTFVSTINNTTFALLVNELNILKNRYERFNATVLSGNILRTKGEYITALGVTKDEINNKLTPLQEYITSLIDQLKSFQPNTTTTDANGVHGVVVTYPPEYYEYQEKLDTANRLVKDYQTHLKNIETRYNKLKDVTEFDDAAIAAAETDLAAIEADTRAFTDKVNATIADYFDTTFVASSVRRVRPPVVTRRSLQFNLALVYVVAVIVAVLAAGVVTGIKISKTNASRKAETTVGNEQGDKDKNQ